MGRKKKRNSGTLNTNSMECNLALDHIERYNELLITERKKTSDAESKAAQLSMELEKIKTQLEIEKSLKEKCIDQERQQKQTEIDEQRISTDIQVEKEKNKSLLEELLNARISYKELTLAYQMEMKKANKRAEKLEKKLERQKVSNQDKGSQQILDQLKAEQDNLRQQMMQETALMQRRSVKNKKRLQAALDKTKASYQELSSKYEADISAGKKMVEKLQMDLSEEMTIHAQAMKEDLDLMEKVRAERDAEQERLSLEIAALKETSIQKEEMYQNKLSDLRTEILEFLQEQEEALKKQRKKSFWKRVKHFLGL